ncbi:MAG: hypothetical protein HY331_05135 [Chloroflexi bacterium]|nr:hypothetical protein [Chloroflexota bacterium]
MPKELMGTHVVIPRELVESVDQLVGRRGRNKFFAEAIENKLARLRLARIARSAAGSLAQTEIPGWESGEAAAEWVRASRQADDASLR